jgi:hypothetical protein
MVPKTEVTEEWLMFQGRVHPDGRLCAATVHTDDPAPRLG